MPRVALLLDTCVFVYPICFPSCAAIVGKRLFGLRRVVADFPDRKSNPRLPSVDLLLIVKVAAAVFALADARFAQGADIRRGEVEVPFMGVGVIPAQGKQFDMTGRTIALIFGEVGAPAPNAVNNGLTIQVSPGG